MPPQATENAVVGHGPLIAHRCHIRSLSGLYTVVCLRKSSEALALGPPFQGPLKVFHAQLFLILVKNVLSAHIIFSEPHHNLVLCPQGAPKSKCNVHVGYSAFKRASNNRNVQVLCFTRVHNSNCIVYVLCFRRNHNSNCDVQVLHFQRGPQ